MLLVAAGGSVGAVARVGLAHLFPIATDRFLWATFVENVSGAFALALVLTLLAERSAVRPEVRLAICTGVLGAFTTYSTLAGEVVDRLLADRLLLGGGYAVGSVLAGVAGAFAGVWLGRAWIRPPRARR